MKVSTLARRWYCDQCDVEFDIRICVGRMVEERVLEDKLDQITECPWCGAVLMVLEKDLGEDDLFDEED